MVKGVKPGTIMKKSEKDKNTYLETVANNVVDYLMMQKGGHYRYGMGYMFSQVWKKYRLVASGKMLVST